MNASEFNLLQTRELLSNVIEVYDNLLDELENESKNLDGWAKKKFDERFEVLVKMGKVAIDYDLQVQKYVRFHPDGHNVKYYRDQLQVAKLYIEANGLDWSTVVWGKISDY